MVVALVSWSDLRIFLICKGQCIEVGGAVVDDDRVPSVIIGDLNDGLGGVVARGRGADGDRLCSVG